MSEADVYWINKKAGRDPYQALLEHFEVDKCIFVRVKEYQRLKTQGKLTEENGREYEDGTLVRVMPFTRMPENVKRLEVEKQ